MKKINCNFNEVTGKIKPVHGVNNCSRQTDYGDVLPEFLALNLPFVRLHDAGGNYGGSHYIDVPNIFPDFSADENDENSYDFTLTDLYLKPLCENRIEIMYRLGVTIEHEPKKYRIYPPSDTAKWARVCEHIVRHYNDGWADGFNWNIKYWEIWNEPDALNPACEPNGCPNWTGTAQEYYHLYSVTANEIKSHHPSCLVGGYSSCFILGKFIDGRWIPGDASFFTGFLDYIIAEKTKAPLDFFTWHGYLGKNYLDKIRIESEFVDEILNKYGFTETKRIDAEWNTNICNIETDDRRTQYYINYRNELGASHTAAAMYEMQRCKIDAAMYYETQLWKAYGTFFEVPSLKPTKTYFAFKQFSEIYKLGLGCKSNNDGLVYSIAAKNDSTEYLCISNISDEALELELNISGAYSDECEIIECSAD